jgi:hypothetical protein
VKRTVFSLAILILAFSLYFSINMSIENQARLQNNFNLNSVVSCVENEFLTHEKTSENLTSALNSCAKGQRSLGITGDIFVIRKSDKKLFWDSSQDCKPESELKLFMTADGICSLFKEPETCITATNYMLNNPPKGDLTWKFDDSIEYVDYRYFPDEIQGEEYIIGQGAQSDEVNSPFMLSYIILTAGTILLLVITSF